MDSCDTKQSKAAYSCYKTGQNGSESTAITAPPLVVRFLSLTIKIRTPVPGRPGGGDRFTGNKNSS
jgi:hypothetical protein